LLRSLRYLASFGVIASLAGPALATPVAPVEPDATLPLSNQEVVTALGRARSAQQRLVKQIEAVRLEQERHTAAEQAKIVELATAVDRLAHDMMALGSIAESLELRRATTARANQWLAVAVALAILAVLAGLGTVARRMSEVEARLRALEGGSAKDRAPTEAA
jgi:hypothetical protein